MKRSMYLPFTIYYLPFAISIKDGIEAFVGGTSIGVDVTISSISCVLECFGIVDEVVHERRKRGIVLIFERTATSLECLCLTELLVVGTEEYWNAVNSSLGHVVD